jgi:glycosyltransferase involved in cell wall biosynthesis
VGKSGFWHYVIYREHRTCVVDIIMTEVINNDLRLISIIIGGNAYKDRMDLLYALDPHVTEHVILTRDEAGDVPVMKNTRVLRPTSRLRGPWFCIWAGLTAVRTVLKSPKNTKWLISEHFWWFGLLLPRFVLPHRVVASVSLYAPNRSLFMNKGWLADPYVGELSKRQCRYYARRYKTHMIIDCIGCRIADAFIVNSEAIRKDILKFSAKQNVIVMPTSIGELQHEQCSLKPKNNNCLTFLYVGLMQPRKGIGLLLEAFSRASKENPHLRLVLIGRYLEVDREWFTSLIRNYDNASAIEYLPHMPFESLQQQYRECDVFVFPSFHEGSPRVVKEAMAYSAPIIANDIPGIRLIDQEGEAIQFVEPGSIEQWVSCICSLASDPDRRLAIGRRSRIVVAHSTHSPVAVKLAATYREILYRQDS